MRKFFIAPVLTGGGAKAPPPPPLTSVEIGNVKKKIVQACADYAWKRKRDLHRAGFFALELPKGTELPLWAAMVIEEFRLRKGHWDVQALRTVKGGKRFLVRWLGWMNNARGRKR